MIKFELNLDQTQEQKVAGSEAFLAQVKNATKHITGGNVSNVLAAANTVNSYSQVVSFLNAAKSLPANPALDVLIHQVTAAAVKHTQFWDSKVDVNAIYKDVVYSSGEEFFSSGVATKADYIIATGQWLVDNASSKAAAAAFNNRLQLVLEGLNTIHSQYRILSDVQLNGLANQELAAFLANKTYVNPDIGEQLDVLVTSIGVQVKSKANTKFTFSGSSFGDYECKLVRQKSILISEKELPTLLDVCNRTMVHGLESTVKNGRTMLQHTPSALHVQGSLLNKIFLIKHNNLDYSKLLETGKEGYIKIVSVNKAGIMGDVNLPQADDTLRITYMKGGLLGGPEALAGYVAPLVEIPALLALTADESGNVVVITTENANKSMARHQKLNLGGEKWSIGRHKIHVAYSTEYEARTVQDIEGKVVVVKTPFSQEIKNKMVCDLSPSTLISPGDFLERCAGLARITSPMHEGGLKTVTNPGINPTTGAEIVSVPLVGPNGFKGGIYSAAMLLAKQMGQEITVEMIAKRPGFEKELEKFVVSNLKTIDFLDYKVQVIEMEVELFITNPVTLEMLKYADENLYEAEENELDLAQLAEGIFGFTSRRTSRLRAAVMKRVVEEPDFKAMSWLKEQKEAGIIVEKELHTRVTPSAHEAMASWHSEGFSKGLIDFLIEGMNEGDTLKKRTVSKLFTGAAGNWIVSAIDAVEIFQLLKDNCEYISDSVKTYPTVMLEALEDKLIQASLKGGKARYKGFLPNDFGRKHKQSNFIEVNFDGYKVLVPALGEYFYTFREIKAADKTLATGFLESILDAVKAAMSVDTKGNQNLLVASLYGEGMKLDALIHSQLLGKNYGYLPAQGSYFLAINPIGRYDWEVDQIGCTNSQMFTVSVGDNVELVREVCRTKYPAYHDLSIAKCRLEVYDFGTEVIDWAFQKAAVMSSMAMFSHIDDFDGDQVQLLKLSQKLLDMMKSYDTCFDGDFGPLFEARAWDEANATLKAKALSFSSLDQLQNTITAAATASANIGKFTSTKYRIESVLGCMEEFQDDEGVVHTLDLANKKQVISMISLLCQLETMDNIKQSDSKGNALEFIMKELNPVTISNKVHYGDPLDYRRALVKRVGTRIQSICDANSLDNLPPLFGQHVVKCVLAVADTLANSVDFDGNRLRLSQDVFNNYTVGQKRFDEVAESLRSKTHTNEFNLFGKAREFVDSADSGSMYNHLLRKLIAIRDHNDH